MQVARLHDAAGVYSVAQCTTVLHSSQPWVSACVCKCMLSCLQGLQPLAVQQHSSTSISVTTIDAQGLINIEPAVLTFGGQLCCSNSTDVAQALTADAWLFVFESNVWARVVQPAGADAPSPRMRHSCAPSSVVTSALVCFGGVGAAGGALADTWLLVVEDVDLQRQEARAQWAYLQVPLVPGPRHSASLLSSSAAEVASLPNALPDVRSTESFVLLGGSASLDALNGAGAEQLPTWMLSLAFDDGCGWYSAAWHALQPNLAATPPSSTAEAPADALTTFTGHSVASGSAGSASEHLQLQQSLTAQVASLLAVGCLLQSTALSGKCPGMQKTTAACLAGAHTSDISVSVDASAIASAQGTMMLPALQVRLQDTRAQSLPVRNARWLPASEAALQAEARMGELALAAPLQVQLTDVVHVQDTVQADVIAEAHGLQLGRAQVQLTPGGASSVSLPLQAPQSLTVQIDRSDAALGASMNASLLLRHNGSTTAWAQLHDVGTQLSENTWTWQVRVPAALRWALHVFTCRLSMRLSCNSRQERREDLCSLHVQSTSIS